MNPSLKVTLRNSGYSMNDLWMKLQQYGSKINRMDFQKCATARRAGSQSYWNDILYCLDEMGVDR